MQENPIKSTTKPEPYQTSIKFGPTALRSLTKFQEQYGHKERSPAMKHLVVQGYNLFDKTDPKLIQRINTVIVREKGKRYSLSLDPDFVPKIDELRKERGWPRTQAALLLMSIALINQYGEEAFFAPIEDTENT
jgi:hypothetical protein